jgi:hypothetical protein
MLLSDYLYTLIGDWLFTLQHRWQQTLIDQLSGSSPKKSKKNDECPKKCFPQNSTASLVASNQQVD